MIEKNTDTKKKRKEGAAFASLAFQKTCSSIYKNQREDKLRRERNKISEDKGDMSLTLYSKNGGSGMKYLQCKQAQNKRKTLVCTQIHIHHYVYTPSTPSRPFFLGNPKRPCGVKGARRSGGREGVQGSEKKRRVKSIALQWALAPFSKKAKARCIILYHQARPIVLALFKTPVGIMEASTQLNPFQAARVVSREERRPKKITRRIKEMKAYSSFPPCTARYTLGEKARMKKRVLCGEGEQREPWEMGDAFENMRVLWWILLAPFRS